MDKQKGFLRYNPRTDRYAVDWRQTLSLAVGELLLDEILVARPYFRGRLLDVGCGKRPYSLIYDRLVDTSVGTEVSFSPHGTADADVLARAEALPFRDNSFDTVVCTEVLEHTQDPFRAIRELSRLLTRDGHLLLSVPFLYPVHEAPHDYWRLTPQGLEAMLQSAGLVALYVHPKGGPVATFVSLSANLAVRATNALSNGLRLSKPLAERTGIRWLLALPQWAYLWACRRSTACKRRSWVGKLELWMTPGYVVLAQRERAR